jgi:hypothetical protein
VIGTDLIYNNTSAEEAYEKFPTFARKAFQPACAIIEQTVQDGIFQNRRCEQYAIHFGIGK